MSDRINIAFGASGKPAASESLVRFFKEKSDYDGHVFIGYPIINTPDGPYPLDALWVSKKHGLVIFDLIEGKELGKYKERQDDAANKLEAKLRPYKELTSGRKLLVPISTVSFAPALSSIENITDEGYYLGNLENVDSILAELDWAEHRDLFDYVLSILHNISTIRKSKSKRKITKEDSRGGKLKKLEDSIATLDNLQSKAVIETVDGVQRIRGLAGSGKTIVLALKAAYLHALHPDWRIAVTFNTRSLKGQFRRLINTFCIEKTGEEPNWENLRILNAWGAPGGSDRDGIYHEFCQANDVPYFDFATARDTFGKGREFGNVCDEALKRVREDIKVLYDAILVDEAQDFSKSFLKMCYFSLDENKRLVYAYDELQNLYGETMLSPEEIFGHDLKGTPNVTFVDQDNKQPKRDIILKKCYRNSRPVLVTAHALGFGIYRKPADNRKTGLVQMFDRPSLWEEIGYTVKNGELEVGCNVSLHRTEDASPKFLETHSSVADLIQFKVFKTEEEQNIWLAKAIKYNLTEDELRCDDIIVINPDPIRTNVKVGPIRKYLLEHRINSHLAGVDTNPDIFFETESESVTFTGIYRAKGNEAGMVYIINANECQSGHNLTKNRNRLFTAITRSKAWVRVLGVGEKMQQLIEEYEKLISKDFVLNFKYPTEDERKHLQIVHRDMTSRERKSIANKEENIYALIKDIKEGKIHLEDLDESILNELRDILKE